MKNLYRLSFLIVVLTLTACSDHTFRSIDEFEISEGILTEGEQVQVIYSSGAPDSEISPDYYVHLIVVGQDSKDTVNLLANSNYTIAQGVVDYYFIPESSSEHQIMMDLEHILKGGKLGDKSRRLEKVVSNIHTVDQEKNDYPTVIGTLVNEIHKPTPAEWDSIEVVRENAIPL